MLLKRWTYSPIEIRQLLSINDFFTKQINYLNVDWIKSICSEFQSDIWSYKTREDKSYSITE